MVTFTYKSSLMQMGCKMLRKKGFRHAEAFQGPGQVCDSVCVRVWYLTLRQSISKPISGKRVERVRDANCVQLSYKVNESGV